MRDDSAEPAETPGEMSGIVLGERHIKMLRFAVIAMGVILVLGFVAVVARIVYLVNRGSDTASTATTLSQPVQQAARLALPAGASIRHISLSGSRLAVHHEGPAGSGILILDLQTGKPLSRIEIIPEAPR